MLIWKTNKHRIPLGEAAPSKTQKSNEICDKMALKIGNEMAEEITNGFGNEFKDCLKKLWELNVCACDSINSTVLIDQDSEYILYDYKSEKMKRLSINSVEEAKNDILSDLIYY